MNDNQKTYLVLPHLNAGLLSPEELEHLAALARKYRIPKTKITGAQRVAFLGMEPEALAAMKEELQITDTPPHARNRVHYVQACPGSAWCPFGQKDALALGERIKAIELDGPLPYKVKVGISGCRFCCCESWIRDVGLTAEKKGWRFSFGGNGAGRPRIGDLVAEGLSDDDAVSLVTKTLNYYLREAKFKTRSARFMERFGIDALKKAVLD
ncbi:MAG: nitrite reductase [Desulfobulbus sp.]|jgi:NAD(P)H-nitrite reductase large subunit|uniref:nitrite reductase n=1 Tax=Desulfobulbus sp. TaxID=895 RepID=UPI00284E4D0A|nr:nitrite reductase [Desulfobulbus sp.]MDR2549805.1 nitrite reductase [Desulfobulbus sp.]